MRRYLLDLFTVLFLATSIISLSAAQPVKAREPSPEVKLAIQKYQAYCEKQEKVRKTFSNLYSLQGNLEESRDIRPIRATEEDKQTAAMLAELSQFNDSIFFAIESNGSDFYGAKFVLSAIQDIIKKYEAVVSPLLLDAVKLASAKLEKSIENADKMGLAVNFDTVGTIADITHICEKALPKYKAKEYADFKLKGALSFIQAVFLFRNQKQAGEDSKAACSMFRTMGALAHAQLFDFSEEAKAAKSKLYEPVNKISKDITGLVKHYKGEDGKSDDAIVANRRKVYADCANELQKIIDSI